MRLRRSAPCNPPVTGPRCSLLPSWPQDPAPTARCSGAPHLPGYRPQLHPAARPVAPPAQEAGSRGAGHLLPPLWRLGRALSWRFDLHGVQCMARHSPMAWPGLARRSGGDWRATRSQLLDAPCLTSAESDSCKSVASRLVCTDNARDHRRRHIANRYSAGHSTNKKRKLLQNWAGSCVGTTSSQRRVGLQQLVQH